MPTGRILSEEAYRRVSRAVRTVERLGAAPTRLFRRRALPSYSPGGGASLVAKVDSDAAGGGYYNCHLQVLDATNWNTSESAQLVESGESIVVANLAEIGADTHNLDAGDLIVSWPAVDDEGNTRYLGFEVFGRYLAGGKSTW